MDKIIQNRAKKHSLISLDWLQFSVKTTKIYQIEYDNQEIQLNKHLILKATHRKSIIHQCIWEVIYKGMYIAEMQTCPKKNMGLDDNHVIFKFCNEILATNQVKNLFYRMKYAINWTFIKFSQLDIAVDTEADGQEQKLLKKYCSGKIDFVGNSTVTAQFNKSTEIRYFRIGSKKSDKFVRCYYKRQELERSNKRYIADYWYKNGFDPSKEVWRVELSLNGALMNKITMPEFDNVDNGDTFKPFMNETTIELIQNEDFIKSLFNCEAGKMLKYYKVSDLKKKKRTNRVKQKLLFSFDIKIGFLFDRIKDKASKYVHRTKVTAKLLHEAFVETKQKVYRDLANDLCENAGLLFWKWKNEASWEREKQNKMSNPIYQKMISGLNNQFYLRKEVNYATV